MAEIERLYVRVLGDITDLRKKMSKAEKVTEEFGYRTQQVGKAITVGLTLPIAAAGAAATKLASDAAEAANKFEVVMGDSADRVRQRFEELHRTIPLTMHEMEGLAATVQDLLVPMGVARDRAADMSAQFVELAGDLASFNNINPAEALRSITSGLAGEAEPLRRFGVDIRVARLETLALEMGLIEAGEALNRTARALAVMEAVTRDSSDAIGDAARTADSAANQFKFFLRNVKELGVTIGDQLLPVVTPLVRKLNDMLASMGAAENTTLQWVIAVTAVTAALGPLLLVVGKVTQAAVGLRVALMSLGLASGPAGWVVVGIGAIVTALGGLATMWTKNKIEAAALRAEMERIQQTGVEGLTGEQLQAQISSTTADRDRVNRELAALRLDMGPNSTTTVSRERLQEKFNEKLKEAIRLQGELTRLRREALRRQTLEGVSGGGTGGGGGGGAVPGDVFYGMPYGPAFRFGARFGRAAGMFAGPPNNGAAFTGMPDFGFGAFSGGGGSGGFGAAGSALAQFGGAAGAGPIAQLGSMVSSLATPVGIAGAAIKGLSSIMNTSADRAARFGRALDQLNFKFGFLDIDDPAEQFRQVRDLLIQQIGPEFGGVDLTKLTPENFDQYAGQIEQIFAQFGGKAGPRAFEMIFGITLDQARQSFGRLESAADGLTESFDSMNQTLNAPRGFIDWLARGRFYAAQAPINGGGAGGGGGPGGPGRGGGGGNRPGIEIEAVYITADPNGDSPEGLWQKFTTGARQAARRGDADAQALGF